MKILKIAIVFLFTSLLVYVVYHFQSKDETSFFLGNDKRIQYVGRFDFSDEQAPKTWAPGAYLEFDCIGTEAFITIEDELKFGKTHNYIQIVVDGQSKRIKLKGKVNRLRMFSGNQATKHHVLICKNTESAIGYIKILGIQCKELVRLKKKRKKLVFEFIGDSITCGNGADSSSSSFGKGTWYDYHNAYLSYGASLAREFEADWILSAVSGIGMHHSCCGIKHAMPEVYEHIDFHPENEKWSFRIKPQVVFITLGQNDGSKAMKEYEKNYVAFLQSLRKRYPTSYFICSTSPMADRELKEKMNASIRKIVQIRKKQGDNKVHSFSYKGIYTDGYDKHPTITQHQQMKNELLRFVRSQKTFLGFSNQRKFNRFSKNSM
jgi:lysophospholipase L1-like esterase